MGFSSWWKQEPPQKKRAPRHRIAGMVAYYWDGGAPKEHPVRDISLTGAFVCATERWYLGTILTMTLQQQTVEDETVVTKPFISVPCKIVRQDPDGGVGVRFMFPGNEERKAVEKFIKDAMRNPHSKPDDRAAEGQALVEFALIVPLVFLLIINAVNFGGFLYDLITVANAARAGAQYAALGASSVQTPPEATFTQVQTLVQKETSSLANASSTNPSVTVCVNNNGTQTVLSSSPATACTTAPTDPEIAVGTTPYTTVAVDVTYTYSPFIPLFDFPSLGIHATIPTTTIHRQAIMRVLN
jgi:Flp pilus assembly protein TadG